MSVSLDLVTVQRRIDAIAGAPPESVRPSLPGISVLAAAGVASLYVPSPALPADAGRQFGRLVASGLDALVRNNASASRIDPALLRAVIGVESGGDARATSKTGAAGLMQLMPGTAQALGVANPYDPAQNVRGGATYLRQLLDRFGGEVPTALAAYNAGPGAVERFGGIPPYAETQTYVARVMDAYRAARAR